MRTANSTANSVVTRIAASKRRRLRAPYASPISFSATKANPSSTKAATVMNCSSTSFPATYCVPSCAPDRTNQAKQSSIASVRIRISRLALNKAVNAARSSNPFSSFNERAMSASPNSKATHSAMAVPAPIPAGPQPSPATNQMSKTMFTPFITICMASSAPVRPVPSNQPVIAYCVSKAGAPQTRAAK